MNNLKKSKASDSCNFLEQLGEWKNERTVPFSRALHNIERSSVMVLLQARRVRRHCLQSQSQEKLLRPR